MYPGRKNRNQPREEKFKANKKRTDTHPETTSRPKQMNFIASPREIEYVESSHPSILARGTGMTTSIRSRYGTQPHSKRHSDDRRPSTPAPSLISSNAMSPPSISTISPTTPVFDTALSRPSITRPSHNRIPTPLDFDQFPHQKDQSSTKPHATEYDFDPVSTYQPRRMIPINTSTYNSTHPTSTEETSYIDWDDDDSSRLQRMKQSLAFTRPHRSTKPQNLTQSKNPDKQLNAIPRVQRSPRSPQPTSPTYTYTPHPRSPTSYSPIQQRSPAVHVPPPSEQVRYQPSNVPPPSIQHLPTRYPEPNRTTRQHILTTTPLPHHIRQDHLPPHSRPSYTSQVRSTQLPTHPNQKQHKDYTSTTRTEAYKPTIDNENIPPKSKRLQNIIRGVAKRVSMRDLRKEAGTRK